MGQVFATLAGMGQDWPELLAMPCPACGQEQTYPFHATHAVAWYACQECEAEWSTRIRDGRPDTVIVTNPSET